MFRSPLRLRTKIAVYFTLLLVCWGIFIVITVSYLLTKTGRGLYRNTGVYLTKSLADECSPLVFYEEFIGLTNLINKQLQTIPELRYIIVTDTRNVPLGSSFRGGVVPDELLSLSHPDVGQEDVSSVLIRYNEELIYDYRESKGNIIVRLGLSLTPVQEIIQSTVTFVLWVACSGLLAVFILALYISRPLEALSTAVEKVISLYKQADGNEVIKGTLETSAIAERFYELMKDLEERTHQLDTSKKLAYVGEIYSNIAHEINNPLGVIIINSELLLKRARKGEISSEYITEIERIHQVARRAALISQKFLQLARYTPHGETLKLKPCNIDDLVHETINLLNDKLKVSKCTVSVVNNSSIHEIICDEQGIQQVILNLLTNAIDAQAAKDSGSITVNITSENGWLILKVIDKGEGMTPNVLKRAKELFFTTKEMGKGTGLGLAISDSIIKLHGGELSLETEPRYGTTASVKIPIKKRT